MTAIQSRRTRSESQEKAIEKTFIVFMLFAVVHFGFRYILRFSDSGTSVGYSDTPVYLSILKDIALVFLFLALCFITAMRSKGASARQRVRTTAVAVGIALFIISMLAISILKYSVFDEDIQIIVNSRTLWLPMIIIPMCLLVSYADFERIIQVWARIITPVMLIFWTATLLLYLVIHRLPALSYVGSPRFGGILDDPNGYGVLCVLILAITWEKINKFVAVLIFLNIAFTVSLSSYVALIVFFIIFSIYKVAKSRTNYLVASGILLSTLLISSTYLFILHYESIMLWWENKSRSINQRSSGLMDAISTIQTYGLADWIFGTKGFTESQLSLTLLNAGLIGLIFQFVMAVILIALNINSRSENSKRIGFWGIAVLISSLFVPYLYVYPISLLFWGVLCMSALSARKMVSARKMS